MTYVILNSTVCKFLPAGSNIKELWKHILHPKGNKWRSQLGWQKYRDGVVLIFYCTFRSKLVIFPVHEIEKKN